MEVGTVQEQQTSRKATETHAGEDKELSVHIYPKGQEGRKGRKGDAEQNLQSSAYAREKEGIK